MITLRLTKGFRPDMKVGNVLHLRIKDITEKSPGRWQLTADDVTPSPKAEICYTCEQCGIVEPAQEDGSLPVGWLEKKVQEGSTIVCSDKACQDLPVCRVCGCTNERGCVVEGDTSKNEDIMSICTWVEPDLCSACVGKEKKP